MKVDAHDEGMTLIEILIATMITAVILTVLVASFIVFFKNSTYISGRDDHAAGAEALSSFLDRDLASATSYTTAASPLTTCPNGSSPQTILSLAWTEYGAPTSPTPVPPDIDPTPNGTTFSAVYTLEHDDSALPSSDACMIQRTYSGGSTTVLIRGLANIGITKPTTSTSCSAGQSVLLTLNQYQSTSQSDTSAPYRYVGCLKARTNGLP